MIYVLSDFNQLSSPVNQIVLDKVSVYPDAYRLIMTSLQNQEDQIILVSHSAILQWIKNMSMRYPQGTFAFETIDARGALAQRWGIIIPENITNEDILQAGLLSLDLHPQPGFSFADTLLSHYFAPIFTSKTFPFTQLHSLLDAVNPENWKANRAIPLLARTLHTRLEEWKSNTRSSEQRQLVELYASDPTGLKQMLMRYRVLQSYPAIGKALLGDSYSSDAHTPDCNFRTWISRNHIFPKLSVR